ncbi:hypothetical protein CPB85DRAFT_1264291 [Mucidula mucida]|nr:hypothetical protein CPB85DRAFT_1264291 [Mucidula mucida]
MKASVTSKADKARTQCDEDSILRVWNVSTPGPGTTLASDDENSSPKVDEPFRSKAVYGGKSSESYGFVKLVPTTNVVFRPNLLLMIRRSVLVSYLSFRRPRYNLYLLMALRRSFVRNPKMPKAEWFLGHPDFDLMALHSGFTARSRPGNVGTFIVLAGGQRALLRLEVDVFEGWHSSTHGPGSADAWTIRKTQSTPLHGQIFQCRRLPQRVLLSLQHLRFLCIWVTKVCPLVLRSDVEKKLARLQIRS